MGCISSKRTGVIKIEDLPVDEPEKKTIQTKKTDEGTKPAKDEVHTFNNTTILESNNNLKNDLKTRSKPDDMTVDSKPDDMTVDSKPDDMTVDSKPDDMTVDSKPDDMIVDSKSDGTTVDSKPDGMMAGSKPDDTSTGSKSDNADGNHLVLFSESCKAFPRPLPPPLAVKTDLDHYFPCEHKDIYPGFDAVAHLDEHVEKTPKDLKQNIASLVEYLIKVTSTDYDKARVIIRWVATNIRYDVEFLTTGEHSGPSDAQSVINEGSAVCTGFSNLLVEMCSLCNLPCEKISGIAKGAGYSIGDDLVNNKKFRHTWNRIQISGTWFLCDATWASGYPKQVDGKYNYIFDWDDGYFLVPPETLRYSHKPDDSRYAMVDEPINDIHKWTNQARLYPSGCLYKVFSEKPSLDDGLITTDSNRLEFTFRSDNNMILKHSLVDESTEENIQRCIACIQEGKTWTLLVRLPKAGVYRVNLFGTPQSLSERSKKISQDTLMSFRVKSTCASGSTPFPEFTHLLGPLPAFIESGFKSTVPYPIIVTENGYTNFTIQKPGGERLRFDFRDECDNDLNEYVFADAFPGKVVFNVRCPKEGEYSLIIFARLNEDQSDKHQFMTGATYLIQNKKNMETQVPPCPRAEWGPNEKLAKLEILLDPTKGSEIMCNKDEGIFELSFNEKEMNLLYSLKSKKIEKNKWIYAETKRCGNYASLKIRFRIPVIGFYEFNLFAGLVGGKTNDFIGRWLVNVVKPYEGEIFGFDKTTPWGANAAKMLTNKLQILSPNSSSVTNDQELTIISTKARKAGITFTLKNNLDSDLSECVLADTMQQNDKKTLYKFHPPESGFYCLDLFGIDGHIGSWMVYIRKSEKLELPENNKQPWGPVQRFYDLDFSVIEPQSAIINTITEVESRLVFMSKHINAKIIGKLNFYNQNDEITDAFKIDYFEEDKNMQKIAVTFKLTMKGYYNFSLFISNTGQGTYEYGGGWLLHCD